MYARIYVYKKVAEASGLVHVRSLDRFRLIAQVSPQYINAHLSRASVFRVFIFTPVVCTLKFIRGPNPQIRCWVTPQLKSMKRNPNPKSQNSKP